MVLAALIREHDDREVRFELSHNWVQEVRKKKVLNTLTGFTTASELTGLSTDRVSKIVIGSQKLAIERTWYSHEQLDQSISIRTKDVSGAFHNLYP